MPLELIGFKFAKCTTHAKLVSLDHVCNMEDIISEINQGCLVCIPNQDIPNIEEGAEDQTFNEVKLFQICLLQEYTESERSTYLEKSLFFSLENY